MNRAIAVNQAYYGFSGSAFKNSNAPPDAPGAFVLALPCNASDATQQGWAYDSGRKSITFGGQCVDASDNDQLKLATCASTDQQKFNYNAQKQFESVGNAGNCVDVWGGNGPPGGPAVQIFSCHASNNQEFTVAGGTIADGDNLCLTSRNSVPGTLDFFFKPMSFDGHKFAILLINVANSAADLTFNFADVPGLVGARCAIRDIWARADIGSATASYTAAGVVAHDAAFLMITCA